MDRNTDFESFYRALRDISSSLHINCKIKDVLDVLAKNAAEALDAIGVLMAIYNTESHELELVATYGLSDRLLSKAFPKIGSILDEGFARDKISIISDVLNDPRVVAPQEAWADGIRTIVDGPLIVRGGTLGAIRVYFREQREVSEEEINFVTLVAEIGATFIERDRLIQIQKSQYDRLAFQTEKLSALGRMAAAIAHEINNPLGSIMLFSSNLLKKTSNARIVKEGLEIVLQETVRCKSIIEELLEFSRQSERLMVLADVAEVVEKAQRVLENEFRLRYIRLEKDLRPDLPKVWIDMGQIEQVLINLFVNALEAIEKEGTISVRSSISPDGTKVCLEVSDTGCGISQEHLEKIFEPFFSTKQKGTGLGLAITCGILQKHGGGILASSIPGKGSTFTVELPIPPAPSSGHQKRE